MSRSGIGWALAALVVGIYMMAPAQAKVSADLWADVLFWPGLVLVVWAAYRLAVAGRLALAKWLGLERTGRRIKTRGHG